MIGMANMVSAMYITKPMRLVHEDVFDKSNMEESNFNIKLTDVSMMNKRKSEDNSNGDRFNNWRESFNKINARD